MYTIFFSVELRIIIMIIYINQSHINYRHDTNTT